MVHACAFASEIHAAAARFGCAARPHCLSASGGAGYSQTVAQAENKPDNLGPVVVTAPKRKPAAVRSGNNGTSTAVRAAGRARSRAATPVAATVPAAAATATPLNGNTVTDVASRLGLTVRETPASVDVVNKQTIEERGLRTTTDIAQAAVGVTAGDSPGAPASFSMCGFTWHADRTRSIMASRSVHRK